MIIVAGMDVFNAVPPFVMPAPFCHSRGPFCHTRAPFCHSRESGNLGEWASGFSALAWPWMLSTTQSRGRRRKMLDSRLKLRE